MEATGDGSLDRNVKAKAQAAVGERRSPPVSAQLMQSLLEYPALRFRNSHARAPPPVAMASHRYLD